MIHAKSIERIFYNAGNGYTVATYQTEEELPKKIVRSHPGNTGYFQAVGIELPTVDGVEVELDGEWKETKYGMQLNVSSFRICIPETMEGIKAYLASDMIKGIGPVTAERIVEKFGKKTLYIMENVPEKLLEVSGITESRLETIMEGYQKNRQLRELMVYLAPFGVTSNKLMRIQEHFGNNAYPIIKKNPFRLCEIKGFGFLTVDPIARKAKNFKADNPERIKAAILYVLQRATDEEGHLFLKSEEIVERSAELLNHARDRQKVSERIIKDIGNEMIRKDQTLIGNGGGIYTKQNFEVEMGAAAELMRLLKRKRRKVDIEPLLQQITAEEGITLSKTQEQAVRQVFQYPVSIITGGPGTGKTTLIRIIIRIQEKLNKDSLILLCAPTGRARRRMYEKTGFPAMTMQKAVGIPSENEDEEESWHVGKLEDDFIIADEFGMCDMYLADRFFSAIKKDATLVMIGDKDQLGSVGPGNVFHEMIVSGMIPTTILDSCFRQEEGSTIVENAVRINRKQTKLIYDDTFEFYSANAPEDASEIIRDLYEDYWKTHGKQTDDIQVLSPLKKNTAAGSDALNEMLREVVNPKRRGRKEIKNGGRLYREGDKVMQTENRDDISNGDLGEVVSIFKKEGKTVMRVDFGDDRLVEFSDDDYWPLVHGYAMSVHKSQGNECPVVIIPMLGCFWRMLQRNIFYTGITRATKKVIIVGSKRAVAQAIRNNTTAKRNTLFGMRLKQVGKELLNAYEQRSA